MIDAALYRAVNMQRDDSVTAATGIMQSVYSQVSTA